MKTLTNNESLIISGGLDPISATTFTAVGIATIGAIYCLAKYAPAATKEDEEAFAAMQFINSYNSHPYSDISLIGFSI